MYALLRTLLFRLPPETAHHAALSLLKMAERLQLSRLIAAKPAALPRRLLGLDFPHPVGLAAGLDKNADYIEGLAALGFGFIEVGTVTPRSQGGNAKPRLFRLPAAQGLINRLGFNNHGVDYMVNRLRHTRYRGILGVNIGKNKTTPNAKAIDDYLFCMRKLYRFASYITINISSPNTAGLRDLQVGSALASLLAALKAEQQRLAEQQGRYVPLLIKIAPDSSAKALRVLAQQLLDHKMDGIIATNTTIDHTAVAHEPYGKETGGLSGRPLTAVSTQCIKVLADILGDRLPIIGLGGIMSGEDAAAKIAAGASLVQLYTGFIYHGPRLIQQAVDAIKS